MREHPLLNFNGGFSLCSVLYLRWLLMVPFKGFITGLRGCDISEKWTLLYHWRNEIYAPSPTGHWNVFNSVRAYEELEVRGKYLIRFLQLIPNAISSNFSAFLGMFTLIIFRSGLLVVQQLQSLSVWCMLRCSCPKPLGHDHWGLLEQAFVLWLCFRFS